MHILAKIENGVITRKAYADAIADATGYIDITDCHWLNEGDAFDEASRATVIAARTRRKDRRGQRAAPDQTRTRGLPRSSVRVRERPGAVQHGRAAQAGRRRTVQDKNLGEPMTPDEYRKLAKEGFKEAVREEFRDIKLRLGGWTLKALGAALVTAIVVGLVWFLLTVNGWAHLPPEVKHPNPDEIHR